MTAIKATKNWLENVVINLGLCPFAAKVFYENQILFESIDYSTIKTLSQLIDQSIESILDGESRYSTALIVISSGLQSFEDYLDVFYRIEESLAKDKQEERIQLASFHPYYQFEGTALSDLSNYTNRSPYPLIHILRTDLVEQAIESYPDVESIPINNIKQMHQTGIEKINKLFNL